MKKRILALFTVLLLAALMTTAVFASTSLVLATAGDGVDYDALTEAQTFDVYIVVSPMVNYTGKHYIYRVPEDSTTGSPSNSNVKLSNEVFTLNWDNSSLEVSAVDYYKYGAVDGGNLNTEQPAGDGYKYAFLAKLNTSAQASMVAPTSVTGIGTGTANTGTLVIDFGDTKAGGFAIRSQNSVPQAAVAKVTFKVVSGAQGGEETITLDNTYKVNNVAYSAAQAFVSVTVEAGCEHANKVALTPDQLAQNGLANKDATCIETGSVWYSCPECSNLVEEVLNLLPHSYTVEKFIEGKAPTCRDGGQKAMHCSTDGCTAYDETTVAFVDKLGHLCTEHVYLAPTCEADGYDYYWCTRCHALATELNAENTLTGAYYFDGKLYTTSTATTLLTKVPDAVALAALGHEWVYDRTEGDVRYYVCTRKATCQVADKEVSLADTVRYAANTAKGTGDGLTAANATTYAKAFEDLGVLPAGIDATIYLVETIEIPQLQVSSNNKITKSFEEYRHEAKITVTTAPGVAKAALYFNFASVSQYHLYGPTVFDNIIISSNAKGTTNGSSESISIFARGFRFESTKNLEMKSTLTGTDAVITYSKTNGDFPQATKLTYDFAACKVYLMAGFYSDGTNKALYEGTNGTTFNGELVLNGGEFYVVTVGRNNAGLPIVNSTIDMHIGGDVVIGQLAPISIYSSSFNLSGTVANLHYYGGTIIVGYRGEMQPRNGNQYTVNHFFHNGSGSLKIGDFQMGNAHAKNVNCYYSTTDKANPGAKEFGLGFIAKGNFISSDGNTYSEKYMETNEYMTFTEYCIAYLGGHDFVGGKCSFCEVAPCASHNAEYHVASEATCIQNGVSYDRCSVCYEILSDIIYIDMSDDYHNPEFVIEREPTCLVNGLSYYKCTICNEKTSENFVTTAGPEYHNAEWRVADAGFEYYCSICRKVLITRANNVSTFYVSDNGKADGGFSADYPVNSFEKAFDMAVASGQDATIYIVGTATAVSNCTSSNTHYVFAEPEHDKHITIAGYNSHAVLKICATDAGRQRTIYALNGDTTFENIEFSTWNYVAPEGKSDYFTYIVAQHHHLTFGENVTTDFMRNTSSNKIAGAYYIMGGCYHSNYQKTTATKASECAGGNNHVTFYSGNFFRFFGGSIGGVCSEANVAVDILGDVSFREYMVLGSNENNAGDIVFTLDGTLSTGKQFSLCGTNKAADVSVGAVGDVTVKILSGSILIYNQESKDHDPTNANNVPLGAPIYTDGEEYDVTANLDSLTILYNPADVIATETALRFGYFAGKTITYKKLNSDAVCEAVVNGEHVQGQVVDRVESVCSAQGHVIYNCTACGKNYAEALDEVPHSFGEAITASAATCVKPEIEKYVCACGYIEYKIGDVAATGVHTYDENNVCTGCLENKQTLCAHEIWTTPSEIKTGCGVGTVTTCVDCGKEVIEVTGADHNFGKYTVTVQPTETEPGIKVRSCRRCGKTETAVIYADGGAIGSSAIATDASGNLADIDVATSKLTTAEKQVLNALLQDSSYGSEIKVSYKVDGDKVTDITYSIPLPAEYANLRNVKVVVKDDEGTLHTVEFTVEKGYIVFKF